MSIKLEFFNTNSTARLLLVTFDNEKSLNAQNLEMVTALSHTLTDHKDDPTLAAIVLRGAGEKAFCAGGDIRGLYQASISQDQTTPNPKVAQFFEQEYTLMYQLHTYPKPVIAWGSGIVMGGGLGILAGCSHKIATDSTLMAMPEVSIGLFPDAGGSYFLNRMMGKVGLFLGLTGARFFANDAYHLGLADFILPKDGFDALMNALSAVSFSTDNAKNHALVTHTLNTLHRTDLLGSSVVLDNLHTIQHLMNQGDLTAVDTALNTFQADNDFLKNAIDFYKAGCPTTKALTWEIYHKVAPWSLADILTLELHTAIACCKNGDFAEGVRALLIDKDKNPKWQYSLQTLPEGYIKAHFNNPYTGTHPFASLHTLG